VRRILVGCSLLATLLCSASIAVGAPVAPRGESSRAATPDPMRLVPDPTVAALAAQALVTAPAWTITAAAEGNGTIAPNGAVSVLADSDKTFTMTPAECAVISNVRVDGVDLGALTTYTFHHVLEPHTIVASFGAAPNDTIIASAGPGGSISPAGLVSFPCGATQTYRITADTCSTVADVLVDGVSQGAVISFTFPNLHASHTIAARFVATRQFPMTSSAGPGGSISPAGAASALCGSSRTFTITPNTCFKIADVLVDGLSQGAVREYTFTDIRAAHVISATFVATAVPDTITGSAGPGGAIDPAGTVLASCGSSPVFTITHDRCYRTVDVVVDGVSQGPLKSYKFTNLNGSHTIAASFVASPSYTITASTTGGGTGSIDPAGPVAVSCGGTQTFTIAPGVCPRSFTVVVDGVAQGPVASYTFADVNDSHSIVAAFLNPLISVVVNPSPCAVDSIIPVAFGGPLLPNTTFAVDLHTTGRCLAPPSGTVLHNVGSVVTGANGFIVSSNLPCIDDLGYRLTIDVSANGIFDPGCDVFTCFGLGDAVGIDGIQSLEGTIAPEGPSLSWWVSNLSTYSGFRIHRAADGEAEILVTPVAIPPPDRHPPVQMHWHDASSVPGSRYAYRVEALKPSCSDWFGPVTLTVPLPPAVPVLAGASPNPFHDVARIALDMPMAAGAIRLDVFDVAGRHVRALFAGTIPGGRNVVEWNGLDDQGRAVRAGLYAVRLQGAFGASTKHVVKM